MVVPPITTAYSVNTNLNKTPCVYVNVEESVRGTPRHTIPEGHLGAGVAVRTEMGRGEYSL